MTYNASCHSQNSNGSFCRYKTKVRRVIKSEVFLQESRPVPTLVCYWVYFWCRCFIHRHYRKSVTLKSSQLKLTQITSLSMTYEAICVGALQYVFSSRFVFGGFCFLFLFWSGCWCEDMFWSAPGFLTSNIIGELCWWI